MYRCNICKYKSKDAKDIQEHKKVEHNIVQNAFKCTKCEKVYGNWTTLDLHIRNKHTNRDNDKVPCFLCGYLSNSQRLQDFHYQQKHSNVVLLCDSCGFRSMTQSKLNNHYHVTHRDTVYECSHCKFMATSKDNISEHFLNIHKPLKYNCSQCSGRFYHGRELADHVKQNHESPKIKVVACNQCDFQTENRDYLKDHITSAHKGYILIQAKY